VIFGLKSAPRENAPKIAYTTRITIAAAVLKSALPNHITLFDLAVDPPARWDEQRERAGSSDVCPTWFYWGGQAESIRQGSMDSISEAAVG
jgi:hypothetical protein